jgi:carbohydrate binding domain
MKNINGFGRRKIHSFVSFLLVLAILASVLLIQIQGINQRWSFDFETVSSVTDSGWIAKYGGEIAYAREASHTGNSCLKMTGRTQAWHSPALQLDDIFYQGGPGIYSVTVWVMVSELDDTCLKYGRSIVRGCENTSFIQQYEENYFGVIADANLFSGQWKCIQGSFAVTSDDIHRGDFFWMLDTIDAIEGQVLYIDDFVMYKLSDSTNINDATTPVINDKPFLKYYQYQGMGNYTGDEAAAWYYDRMARMSPKGQYELVFTFTKSMLVPLKNILNEIVQDLWWEKQKQLELSVLKETIENIIGNVFSNQIGAIFTTTDIYETVTSAGRVYFADITKFNDDLTYLYDLPETIQQDVTISICLLRKSVYGGFEYRMYRSDKRGIIDKNAPGSERLGIIDESLYNVLVAYCTHVLSGNYERPIESVSYYQLPSVNKVFTGYSYLQEYTYRMNYEAMGNA